MWAAKKMLERIKAIQERNKMHAKAAVFTIFP
jgi:hypothetical protein